MKHAPVALWLVASCVPTTALGQAGSFRGPYLNDVTQDAVTVLWETPTATLGTVHYGAVDPSEQSLVETQAATHHEARLTGLLALTGGPGREVVYEVEVDGVRHPGRFSTAVDSSTPFAFILYGDNRSNTLQHEAVIDAILNETAPYRFIASTGDMVSNGQDETFWDIFFQVEGALLADTPLYVTLGNHEVENGDWSVVERLFAMPQGGTPPSNSEAFYQVVYGNVQLIVLNEDVNNLFRIDDVTWGPQENWLRNLLQNPPAGVQHRFALIHEGPYSSKVGRNGNEFLRTWLADFATYGVNVIFSGHDHYAERGYAANGIPYVIQGGGGAPLYNTLGARTVPDHTIVYSESRLGYVLVEIDGPLAQVWTKGLDGEVIDYFAYGDATSPECASDDDCTNPPLYACAGGAFVCRNSACFWSGCDTGGLDQLIACVPVIADNCDATLAATCNDAACAGVVPNTYCVCNDAVGDCTAPADCAGAPPPVPGCPGSWVCVNRACEFVPRDGICPAPGGDGDGDGDAAGDPGAGGDGDVVPGDAPAASDPGRGGDAATGGGDAMTAAGDANDGGAPQARGGCNCAGGDAGGLGWLVLVWWAWRQSRAHWSLRRGQAPDPKTPRPRLTTRWP